MVENYEENPGTRKPETKSIIYIIKQDIRIYMLSIADQTAGPFGLNFLWTLIGGQRVL